MLGSYGTSRPANVSPSDVEIFYTYAESRYVKPNNVLKRLDATTVLQAVNNDIEGEETSTPDQIFGGLYNLELPSTEFSDKGIYNIIIRPKEIKTNIIDCAELTGSNTKGLVINPTGDLANISDFSGYRIEYYENQQKIENFFRIVTGSYFVEPISENLSSNSSQKTIKYRINNAGSLIFLTVTPTLNTVEDIDVTPFIGSPSQEIVISNTFFEPIHLEVELTDHDFTTLGQALYGNQMKNIKSGKYGIFDDEGNLIKAFDLSQTLDDFGDPEYEIRSISEDTDEEQLPFNELRNNFNN